MILRFFGILLRLMRMYWDPVKYARSIGVQIGEGCRIISPEIGTFGSEPFLVRIGDHVTIGSDVRFITHDGGVWIFRQQYPDIDVFGRITIGNNVFIGTNAILLPGVVIGDNCVIGAGAVVTRDIPAGCVAVGVPAKPIMSVDEYWQSVKTRSLMIRSMPASEKRRYLEDHFLKR